MKLSWYAAIMGIVSAGVLFAGLIWSLDRAFKAAAAEAEARGQAQCAAQNSARAVEDNVRAVETRNRAGQKASSLDDRGIDAVLRDHGWMRGENPAN